MHITPTHTHTHTHTHSFTPMFVIKVGGDHGGGTRRMFRSVLYVQILPFVWVSSLENVIGDGGIMVVGGGDG